MKDPIEAAAYHIAKTMKKWNPDIESDIDEIRFGTAYYLNYYSVIVISLIVGLITHQFLGTALSLFSFGILRKYTGGFHFRSLTLCALVTVALLSAIPHIPLDTPWVIICNLLSMILVTVYSKRSSNDRRMVLMMISSNMLFLSPVVALSFVAQSMLLIALRR